MKYIRLVSSVLLCFLLMGCNDWTSVEVENPTDLLNSKNTETYYANLRAYKQRTHAIMYGKWQGWTGQGASVKEQMIGLPDSLDIVGLTSDYLSLTADMKSDMAMVQQRKGTKVILALSVKNVGDGLAEGTEIKDVNQMQDYVNALKALVDTNGFDGLDIELRPQLGATGSIVDNPEALSTFIKLLSTSFGPKSSTGKLFVLSGEPESVSLDLITNFDYLVAYTFGATTDSELDGVLLRLFKKFSTIYQYEQLASKLVVMEDFVAHKNGGVPFKDRFNNSMFSLEGMARWMPLYEGKQLNKGGVGIYRMENEYMLDGFYATFPYSHHAIQILNPSIK